MRVIASVILGIALVAAGAAYFTFRPHLPPAERGRRLAERLGCFGCHGPGGIRGAANPGRTDGVVPTFEGDVMMYASSPEEIHEWIHNGVTRKRAASRSWREERRRGALKMPAFGTRITEGEIRDLVAYVMAVSGTPEPDDSLAAYGLERADSLGCTGCHGPGGRLARRNPGSFKGYVPSWDGTDFPDLVRDRAEFEEWVEGGVSRRFARDSRAKFFLDRAVLRMPAYREHLSAGDVDALWAYVRWLRSAETQHAEVHSEGEP